MKRALNAKIIQSLEAREREYVVKDELLCGFGVKVRRSGSKTFILDYTFLRRRRRATLGDGATVPLAAARNRALEMLAEARLGNDPLSDRDRAATALTVRELCRSYIDTHCAARCKPSTVADYERWYAGYIEPRLGHRRIDDIALADVERLHISLRETPTTANRVIDLLSAVLNFAERHGHRPRGSNPCFDIRRYKLTARERFLSAAELQRFGRALRDLVAADVGTASAYNCLTILLLTGCRRDEIRTLRWSDVNLDTGWIRLGDSKTGARNVRIEGPASALLSRLPRRSLYVFPAPSRDQPVPRSTLQGNFARACKAAGIDNVRVHDLRHTHASFAAASGESLFVIGKLLGHKVAATTQRYAHLAEDPISQAAERTATGIHALLAASNGSD